MKIFTINQDNSGSTGTIARQVGEFARQKGHTYEFAYPGYPMRGKREKGDFVFGSKLTFFLHYFVAKYFGRAEYYSFFPTLKLLGELRKFSPDIIHLHNLHGWYLNLPLLFKYIKRNNIRVIWTLHDCWTFTGHCPHFDYIGCQRWKTGCHDCPQVEQYPRSKVDSTRFIYKKKKEWFSGIKDLTLVAPSKWLEGLVKQSYLKDYGVKVIYNGIDLSVFKPTEGDFRKKYGCEDKFILLGVAYFWSQRKGIDVFIELAKRLDSSFQIVLVGTDENVDSQLPDNIISIHRTQNRDELAQIYSAADLFVNPTLEEVIGMVNIEALACGTPVVTFRTGGSPEAVDETCGAVVEKGSTDEMEREIKRIRDDKPFAGEACRRRAEGFDMNDRFREYIELYEISRPTH